jgi:predicted Zn-dependent peptidase
MIRTHDRTRIRKDRLANGITVLTERIPHVRSVSLGVWLRSGSRHEPAPMNGISHFIEHLVFKGTATRTARDIALAVDSIGGQIDAFTTKEYTCFYAKVLDTHLADAVELLADIVRNPKFDAEELERERGVILEEIRMVEDSPEELVYDLFAEHFYARHPLGRPIQGTVRTVSTLTRPRVSRYFRGAYLPENMLVVAAGNVSHGRLVRLLDRRLGAIPRGRRAGAPGRRANGRPAIVRRQKRDLEQIHLLMGWNAFPEHARERYPLYVLNTILGGAMSSRLFQKIREERGLAYSVYSALHAFHDTGALLVYAATSPERGDEVIDLVGSELRDLARHGPDPREVEVAREHLKGSVMLSLESTSSRMSHLARQEIYERRQYGLEEVLGGIDGVEVRHVHAAARKILSRGPGALAAVGRVRALRKTPRGLAP